MVLLEPFLGEKLIIEFKKIHVDKKGSKEGEGVETMSKEDVQ